MLRRPHHAAASQAEEEKDRGDGEQEQNRQPHLQHLGDRPEGSHAHEDENGQAGGAEDVAGPGTEVPPAAALGPPPPTTTSGGGISSTTTTTAGGGGSRPDHDPSADDGHPSHRHAELFRLITRCDVTGVRRYLNREEEEEGVAATAAAGGGAVIVPPSHGSRIISGGGVGGGVLGGARSSAAVAALSAQDPWTGFTPLVHAVDRILTLADVDDVLLTEQGGMGSGSGGEEHRRRLLRLLRRYGGDWTTIVRALLVHGSDPRGGAGREGPLRRVCAALDAARGDSAAGMSEVERGEGEGEGEGEAASACRAARVQLLERTATLLRHYGADADPR